VTLGRVALIALVATLVVVLTLWVVRLIADEDAEDGEVGAPVELALAG
jgi:hypothetical protein